VTASRRQTENAPRRGCVRASLRPWQLHRDSRAGPERRDAHRRGHSRGASAESLSSYVVDRSSGPDKGGSTIRDPTQGRAWCAALEKWLNATRPWRSRSSPASSLGAGARGLGAARQPVTRKTAVSHASTCPASSPTARHNPQESELFIVEGTRRRVRQAGRTGARRPSAAARGSPNPSPGVDGEERPEQGAAGHRFRAGCGNREDFKAANLRYGKVFL